MPTYDYRCENGHTFEVMQRMSDAPLAACQVCGATVQRVFHPIAVHFKGSGFYNTDYGTRKRAREKGEGGEGTSGADAGGDSKSSSDSTKSSDAKPASDAKPSSGSKPESKPSSSAA